MKIRTFFIIMSVAFFSALACCGNHNITEASGINNLSAPANQLEELYMFTTKGRNTIMVHSRFPTAINNDTRILFVLHGAERTVDMMLHVFSPLVQSENIILIVPEFTEKQFNDSRYQNIGIDGNITTPENWTPKIIDDIFLDIKKRFNLANDRYIMYGSSAGAQFSHRAVMYSESDYLDYAIASNAGIYTFPDDQVNHPYGIKNTFPLYGDLIHRNYGRRLYILIGDLDLEITYPELTNSQGPNRYTRAFNFFNASKNYCEQHNLLFNWELREMPGVGHFSEDLMFHLQNILKENQNIHYDIPSVTIEPQENRSSSSVRY